MSGNDRRVSSDVEPSPSPSSPRWDDAVRKDLRDDERPSDAVVEAIQIHGNRREDAPELIELPPIYETVDLGGIDQLFGHRSGTDVSVTFTHERYRVTVSEGEVVVESTPASET